MYILGLNHSGYITSAALIKDGQALTAACEERFNRQKRSRAFPLQAINFCLSSAGINIEDVDYIAAGWNPGINLEKFNRRFSADFRWVGEFLHSVPNNLLQLYKDKESEFTKQEFYLKSGSTASLCSKNLVIYHLNHHQCHCAKAFYPSPFKSAAVVSVDAFGERQTALYARGQDKNLKFHKEVIFPQSLGSFYSTFTEFLGFHADSEEWKVMGAAAYGDPQRFYQPIKNMVQLLDDGLFELDLSYFNYYNFEQEGFYSSKLVSTLGSPRARSETFQQRHFDLAAACQLVTEEVFFHILNYVFNIFGEKNLCLAGGSFLNCVFNGKVLKNTPYEKLFVPPAPDDSGNALGSAMLLYHQILSGESERQAQKHNFYGPSFSDPEIEKVLGNWGLAYRKLEDEQQISKEAAKKIASGRIIGFFQGAMEFGQRALGHRSILADPRSAAMKDRLNSSIKYREEFRPFAPAVLKEKADEFFEIPVNDTVDFMEKVYPVKPEKRDKIPAVVHVDGSGRLQTVDKKVDPLFYKLIEEYEKLTDLPVVLNTSFNIAGEPIVCTPQDAIRTFYTCGLQDLFIGSFLVSK